MDTTGNYLVGTVGLLLISQAYCIYRIHHPIKRKIQFDSPSEYGKKLEYTLRFNNDILRHLMQRSKSSGDLNPNLKERSKVLVNDMDDVIKKARASDIGYNPSVAGNSKCR